MVFQQLQTKTKLYPISFILWTITANSPVKRTEDLSAEQLIWCCKIVFAEHGLPHKIISNTQPNFVSDKFMMFWKKLNVDHSVSSSYNHQSKGQAEA